jgi:hypothetical protein
MILVLHIVVADHGWHSGVLSKWASGPQAHCAERYWSFRTQARLFVAASRSVCGLPARGFPLRACSGRADDFGHFVQTTSENDRMACPSAGGRAAH